MKMEHKHTSILKYLVIIIATAAGYCLTGRLGLLLAIPPGFSTIIWPAAGIALGILLIFGKKYWPGIFIGSFAVNLWIAFDPSTTITALTTTGISAAIGVAATLQAIIGTLLIQKFLSRPLLLCDFKSILIFALLSAPVSALINATVSNLILWFTGTLTLDNLGMNWLNWWTGDCIGLLVFTPLMLILFESPRKFWIKRAFSVGLSLCLLFAICITVFIFMREKDLDDAKRNFTNQVASINSLLAKNLLNSKNTIEYIQRFYESSNHVTRDEFKSFVMPSIKKYRHIQAISWNPIILKTDRKKYIEEAKKEGFPNFEIKQIKNGKIINDHVRPYYYVVYYIEPIIGNKKALGLNLASNPARLNTMNKAANNNQLVVTERIYLAQGTKSQPAVILFAPVHKDNHLIGFLSGVFKIKSLISSVIFSRESKEAKTLFLDGDLSIKLSDHSGKHQKDTLYTTSTKPSKNESINKLIKQLSISYHYKFGSRDWTLTIAPTEKYLTHLLSQSLWVIIIVTLLFIGLVNLFVLVITGQNITIKDQVKRKTLALTKLETEKTLILQSVGEGVVGTDINGAVTFANPEAERLTGYTQDELLNSDLHNLTHRFNKDGSFYDKELCSMHTISENQSIIRNQTDFLLSKNGAIIPIEYTKIPLIDDNKLIGVVISFRDISERIRLEKNYELLKKFDELTGLPNKNSFDSILEKMLLRLHPDEDTVSVCLISIKNLDELKTHFNIHTLNSYIQHVSKLLQSQLRDTDYLAYINEHTFGLFIEHTADDFLIKHALIRFIEHANETITIDGIKIPLTLSIGAAQYPDSGTNLDSLIQHAQSALSDAEKNEKSSYQIYKP